MRPLNYAMLKYFTTVDEACADDVMDALAGDYSTFTAFKRDKPFLQPIADLNGKIVGCEALVRWEHKEYGFLTPIKFIPSFEKNGLIAESRVDLDPNGDLRVFYSASEEQRATIDSYIK